jgi:hypothetical protein
MGLDIGPAGRWDEEGDTLLLPDAPTAQWSYGGFHRFRQLLAAEDGIDLERMAGFTDDFSGKPAPPGKPWSEVATTLAPLLNHSDCDGELTPDECIQIMPRLKEIRVTWKENDADPWDVEKIDALIDVVTYCAATGRNVDFH